MITHGRAFDEPVSGTGWSTKMTCRQRVNCQSKQNRAGANHKSSNLWHIYTGVAPFPYPLFTYEGIKYFLIRCDACFLHMKLRKWLLMLNTYACSCCRWENEHAVLNDIVEMYSHKGTPTDRVNYLLCWNINWWCWSLNGCEQTVHCLFEMFFYLLHLIFCGDREKTRGFTWCFLPPSKSPQIKDLQMKAVKRKKNDLV